MRLSIVISMLIVFEAPLVVLGQTSDCPQQRTYVVYGARLGGDFPKSITTGYDASSEQHLDGIYPIYVDLVLTNADASLFPNTDVVHGNTRRFRSPQLLSTQTPWFMGHSGEFVVVANGIGSADGYGDNFDAVPDYGPCPIGQGLEAPQLGTHALDVNGNLHVKDFDFGGVARKTTITLERAISTQTCTGQPSTLPWLYVAIVIGWEAPGCRLHDWPPPSDRSWVVTPDSTLVQTVNVLWGSAGQTLTADCPRHVVAWRSADFVPASPLFVDAADLSALSAQLNVIPPFSWGICGETEGNWKFDLNQTAEDIDASDISALAAQLGDHCGMPPSKTTQGGESDREMIMTYFGYALTGRMIRVSPVNVVPEWELIDPVRNRLAILDPFGYRERIASSQERVHWSRMKVLYR